MWPVSMAANKPFYQDYSFRKEYMSVGNLVHKYSYLDAEA